MTDEKYQPWVVYNNIWKTKAAWLSWLRGGIRRALWNRSPIKLEFIKKYRRKIKNPNPKGKVKEVWGGICNLCGDEFPSNQLNVDHREGQNGLRELSDLQSFMESIVLVQESDLQFVCLPCHKIKNLQERTGVDFETARVEKAVIEICKNKQDKQWLLDKGITPLGNAKLRRQQITEEMMK